MQTNDIGYVYDVQLYAYKFKNVVLILSILAAFFKLPSYRLGIINFNCRRRKKESITGI